MASVLLGWILIALQLVAGVAYGYWVQGDAQPVGFATPLLLLADQSARRFYTRAGRCRQSPLADVAFSCTPASTAGLPPSTAGSRRGRQVVVLGTLGGVQRSSPLPGRNASNPAKRPATLPSIDIIFALDASGSMLAADFQARTVACSSPSKCCRKLIQRAQKPIASVWWCLPARPTRTGAADASTTKWLSTCSTRSAPVAVIAPAPPRRLRARHLDQPLARAGDVKDAGGRRCPTDSGYNNAGSLHAHQAASIAADLGIQV